MTAKKPNAAEWRSRCRVDGACCRRLRVHAVDRQSLHDALHELLALGFLLRRQEIAVARGPRLPTSSRCLRAVLLHSLPLSSTLVDRLLSQLSYARQEALVVLARGPQAVSVVIEDVEPCPYKRYAMCVCRISVQLLCILCV